MIKHSHRRAEQMAKGGAEKEINTLKKKLCHEVLRDLKNHVPQTAQRKDLVSDALSRPFDPQHNSKRVQGFADAKTVSAISLRFC